MRSFTRLYQFQKYNEAVKYRMKFLFRVFLNFFRAIALRVVIIRLVYEDSSIFLKNIRMKRDQGILTAGFYVKIR